MRLPFTTSFLCAALLTHGQYGSFDPQAVEAARNSNTIVLLDPAESEFNQEMRAAVSRSWSFTRNTEFLTITDLASMPVDPSRTYLSKTAHNNADGSTTYRLAFVQGWRHAQGSKLGLQELALTNVPPEQELAYMDIAPDQLQGPGATAVHLYIKQLQHHLERVAKGLLNSMADADAFYAERHADVGSLELWIGRDRSENDASTLPPKTSEELQQAARDALAGVAIGELLYQQGGMAPRTTLRVFHARTGELLYLRIVDGNGRFTRADLRAMGH